MTFDKFKEAIQFAKDNNLKSIEIDGVKFEIPQEQIKLEPTEVNLSALVSDITQEYTDEEMIYYATPYFDELQEKKKRQIETKNIDEDLRNG